MTTPADHLTSKIDAILASLRGLEARIDDASAPTPALFSPRAAAKRLGCSYTDMKRAIKCGEVLTVPWRGRAKIPAPEVRRLAREGIEPKERRSPRLPPRVNPRAEAARVLGSLKGSRRSV